MEVTPLLFVVVVFVGAPVTDEGPEVELEVVGITAPAEAALFAMFGARPGLLVRPTPMAPAMSPGVAGIVGVGPSGGYGGPVGQGIADQVDS